MKTVHCTTFNDSRQISKKLPQSSWGLHTEKVPGTFQGLSLRETRKKVLSSEEGSLSKYY